MPRIVIKELLEGNENYDIEEDTAKAILSGQTPKITLITCSDSRISGHIMDKDMVNKVFHIRNIGNQIENNYGSVDYGINHLHTPILLILGHTDCGAVKSSQIDFSRESNEIRQELYPLFFNLDKHVKLLDKEDPNYVTKLVQANVDKQVELAMQRYSNKTDVVGAVFDIHGHLSDKQGKIVITNINGITDEFSLRNHELLSEIDEELAETSVKRI